MATKWQHEVIRARHGDIDRSRLRSRASALAIVLVSALSGCAAPGGTESSDLVCNSAQQCRVNVEVACVQGACSMSVDHPRVFARGNDIVWLVVNKPGQSYVFPNDAGIAFKTEAGRNVFRCHAEANGDRYACMNRRTPGTYEYGIRLNGSPAVPPLDPRIVNH
jgi:hypothetical protein